MPGWTAEGVLWEVALREGYGLNTRFAAKPLADGTTVYEAADPDTGQSFAACLAGTATVELSKPYPLTKETVLVVRDAALDDTAAAKLALQCR